MMSRYAARSGATALACALALLAGCSSAKKVTSLEVSPERSSLAKGTSVAMSARAIYDDGSVEDVTAKAEWASGDAGIATVVRNESAPGVYADCRVNGLAVGTVEVSASFGAKKGAASLAITAAEIVSLAVSPGPVSLPKGSTQALTVTATLTDRTTQVVSADTSWSSQDDAIAAVVNGRIEARAVGATTVRGVVNGRSAEVAVTVTAAELASIQVSAARPAIAKGTTVDLTAKAVYGDGTVKDVTATSTWTTSDATKVALSGSTASGAGLGTATVSAAFGGKTGSASIEVTAAVVKSIAITPAPVSLAKGVTQALVVTGTLTDGSTQDVTSLVSWTSTSPTIAYVLDGQLSTKGEGTATVRAAYGDGIKAEAAVTVTAAQLTGIAIDQAPFQIIAELTKGLSVSGFYSDGTSHAVGADWSSDKPAVATVTKDGVVTAAAAGTATLSATVGGFTKTLAVEVVAPTLIAIEIEGPSAPLPEGLTAQLKAVAKYDNGKRADVSADAACAWSSNSAVAAVSATGLVSASKTAIGAAKIIAQYKGFGGVFDLTVSDAVVVKVAIAPSSYALPAGLQTKLAATATLSDDRTMAATSLVTWSTSDATRCTVSNAAGDQGLLEAVAPGACTVSAVLSGVTGTADVVVSSAALTRVTISAERGGKDFDFTKQLLPIGLTANFHAEGTYTDGSHHDITAQVVWTTGPDDLVASISNAAHDKGLASALTVGSTTVRAEDPETHLKDAVTLTTDDAVITALVLSSDKTEIPAGYTLQLKAMASWSIPVPATDETSTGALVWDSSATKVATVDANGLVTGLVPGATVITATNPYTGVKATLSVKVTDALLQTLVVTQVGLFDRLSGTTLLGVAPPSYPVTFTAAGYFSDAPSKVIDLTNAVAWSVDGASCSNAANAVKGALPKSTCAVRAALGGVKSAAVSFDVLDVVLNSMFVLEAKSGSTTANVLAGDSVSFVAWGVYGVNDVAMYLFEWTKLATWTTSDVTGTSVASVSSVDPTQGKVTAHAAGIAVVAALDPLTKVSGDARVNVSERPPVPVTLEGLALTPATPAVYAGETQSFVVTASYSDGSAVDVTGSAVCSVDGSGVATAAAGCTFLGATAGTATITATFDGGVAKTTLTVLPAKLLELCVVAESTTVKVGQNTVLGAFGRFTNTPKGTTCTEWTDVTSAVVWDSSAPAVAQVSNDVNLWGSVTGLQVGATTVTAVDVASLVNASVNLVVVP